MKEKIKPIQSAMLWSDEAMTLFLQTKISHCFVL